MGRIQKLRKEAGLKLDADIEIFYLAETEFLDKAINHHLEEIKKTIMKPLIEGRLKPAIYPEVAHATFVLGTEKGQIWICRPSVSFNKSKLADKFSDKSFSEDVERLFETLGIEYLKAQTDANNGTFKTRLNGEDVELTLGQEFYLDGFKTQKN